MQLNVLIFALLFSSLLLNAQKKSVNGGVFTPKGDLHALVVPVYFKDAGSTNPDFYNEKVKLKNWEMKNGRRLPDVFDEQSGASINWMFNQKGDFEQIEEGLFNASTLFYLQSHGQFRFTVDVFRDAKGKPCAVEIDPAGGRGWSDMNKKALAKMKSISPNFDWAPFDRRTNNPQYKFDNSVNPQPDSVVDYIIFTYRYSPRWRSHPERGMPRWIGSGGGFASPAGIQLETYNGYRFSEGFTMTWGSGVFVHELAHTLFNAPHLWGTNGTVGKYFYRPSIGWGSTATIDIFRMFNAWEAWYMGYLPHLQNAAYPAEEAQEYILQDFFTQGDALRIPIPFSENQFLWLEYHAKLHPFDEHEWANWIIGKDTLGQTPKGVYAYVERVSHSQEKIIPVLSEACNALKPIHAAGNFDYQFDPAPPAKNAWGNALYPFQKKAANPISGTNPFWFVRADLNGDGKINFNTNYNGAKNESINIIREETSPGVFENLYQGFGLYDEQRFPKHWRPGAFQVGDQLNMGSNPIISNYSRYNEKDNSWEPTILNGMQLTFFKGKEKNTIGVRVEYQQTKVKHHVRWAGNIILPNISKDQEPDLIVAKRKKIILNKSATINRHQKNKDGSFINQSQFRILKDAEMKLSKRSKLIIKDQSVLILEKGARLSMAPHAKIILEKGATLKLNGNLIDKARCAKIINKGTIIP